MSTAEVNSNNLEATERDPRELRRLQVARLTSGRLAAGLSEGSGLRIEGFPHVFDYGDPSGELPSEGSMFPIEGFPPVDSEPRL